VAVISAVPYANLHLTPDTHASTPLLIFIDWMPFLPLNQQCQSIEGIDTEGTHACMHAHMHAHMHVRAACTLAYARLMALYLGLPG